MKKLLFVIATALLIVSCGPSKVATQARKSFDGDWMLNTVTYPNNTGIFDVTLFNDASANCFKGSSWTFVSNNNQGNYSVAGADCTAGERNFNWAVDEENSTAGSFDFLLKPTDSKHKSTTGNQGFRLNLVSLSETSMIWEQTVTLEGKPFVIRMNFTKI